MLDQTFCVKERKELTEHASSASFCLAYLTASKTALLITESDGRTELSKLSLIDFK